MIRREIYQKKFPYRFEDYFSRFEKDQSGIRNRMQILKGKIKNCLENRIEMKINGKFFMKLHGLNQL